MDLFRLELFSPGEVYFSGQEIQGQIHIHLSEPKKMSKLRLELRGEGKVHWTETRNRTRSVTDANGQRRTETERETIHHRSHERYLQQDIVLFHGPQLAVGNHVFPFNVFLAPNLPSSFEGEHGSIRYYVQAVIVRDWLWNHRTKQHITVNSVLDLNLFRSCQEPQQTSDHKTFCCFCCKSGPLSVVMHTDRTGYVPGESVVFSAEIDNKSNKEMSSSDVQLVEAVTFKASGHSKTTSRVVVEARSGRVGPGESAMWDRERLRVPPLPPSNLGGNCGIITLHYTLKFSVHPSGIGFSLDLNLPITIGTIPLQSTFNQFTPPSPLPSLPFNREVGGGGFLVEGNADDLPPPYDPNSAYAKGGAGHSRQPAASAPPLPDNFNVYGQELPPPTYEESVWGEVNVRHDDDDENTTGNFVFTPKYVTYRSN